MDIEKLKSIIESLLFIKGEPLKISKLAKYIGAHQAEVENAVMMLRNDYDSSKRGLILVQKEDEIQMTTNPENAEFAGQLTKGDLQEPLSNAGLEVLSIVAYKGPMSRSEIESIRGVNCSYTVRNLLLRGLIERIDNPNDSRGYIYKITFDFLKKIGVESVEKLPNYDELSKDERLISISKEENASKSTKNE
jgi:segregation and condensation protein B